MSTPQPPAYGQQPDGQPAAPAGKEKKPLYKKKRVIIPAALVAVVIIANAGGGSEDSADTTNASNDTTAESEAPAESEAAAPAEPAEPAAAPEPPKPQYAGALEKDKVAEPGGSIDLSGWTVTASALTPKESAFGTQNYCTDVTMVNRDDEQQEYNGLSWKLQTPNGNVQDMTFTGESDLTSGGLAPGGNVSKQVCFEDQEAGAGQYVLTWQPDIFSSEARGVWLNSL